MEISGEVGRLVVVVVVVCLLAAWGSRAAAGYLSSSMVAWSDSHCHPHGRAIAIRRHIAMVASAFGRETRDDEFPPRTEDT